MTIHPSATGPQGLQSPGLPNAGLFAGTAFASAALVFMVQPMAAKLVLPLLGGGPSVWNTSLAFFQIALLAGYAYAHLLQKLPTIRAQVLVHGAVLIAAALALPLRISDLAGPPSSDHPILWLLAALGLAVGAPFAALSATAPIVQAWHARTLGRTGAEPYALYAASNLGSLIALIAYPILVEPLSTLTAQRMGWSAGYLGFVVLIVALGVLASRSRASVDAVVATPKAASVGWRDRAGWLLLAALPSSLMLGVTTHLTTDVASAPFLWIVPLALYLVTFIIAFQTKPAIHPQVTLVLHAGFAAMCAAMLPFPAQSFALELPVHVITFFVTALMCHQALAARRPDASRLTEFYLWMSLGGVLGGAFNAFLAPALFPDTWEYPLVLALACLARPWRLEGVKPLALVVVGAGMAAALISPMVEVMASRESVEATARLLETISIWALGAAAICAFLSRRSGLLVFAVIGALSVGAQFTAERSSGAHAWRSFFGVLKVSDTWVPKLGGWVRMMSHGTTLHGAQAEEEGWRCRPLTYYSPQTAIGQVMLAGWDRPSLSIGAVGLGTGSVAAYVRPRDHLTFFEIDPMVVEVASDPSQFSYIRGCAQGPVDFVIGDARLMLARQPKAAFDILLIDAFSSDAVPAHLLTREAVAGYLERLAPNGVLVLHLSNRNLDLNGPAQAVARSLGAPALFQHYEPSAGARELWDSAEDVLIIGKTPQALAPFAADPRWEPPDPRGVKPWTDDYTNLAGALWRRVRQGSSK